MADRIRGSCRGCLCFRNRGINDLAICRLERAAFLFEVGTGLVAGRTGSTFYPAENNLSAGIGLFTVVPVDAEIFLVVKGAFVVPVRKTS